MENALIMFDVSGIQSFIFSTPKLKEIMGASHLVEEVLGRILRESMDDTLTMIQIYSGGGTALFKSKLETGGSLKEAFERLDRRFKLNVLKETGKLTVVSAFLPYSDDDHYLDLSRELREKLAEKKKRAVRHTFFENDSTMLTKPGTGAGLINHDHALLNKVKLDAYNREKEVASGHKEALKEVATYVDDFDQFASKGSDSYIGIVHIDGNDMGLTIKKMLEKTSNMTTDEALDYHRWVSHAIDEKFFNAAKSGIEAYNSCYPQAALRPIILAGDDITYVCAAKDAIHLSKYILDEIKKIVIDGYRFNACAGIAMVKSHYPFDIAYKLSESLCKDIKNTLKKSKTEGSGINYHYHFKGLETDVETIRKREYPEHCRPKAMFVGQNHHSDILISYEKLVLFIESLKVSGMTLSKLKKLRKYLFLDITEAQLYLEREKTKIDFEPLVEETFSDLESNGAYIITAIELFDYIGKGQ